jgi:hypothetical protein
MSTVTRLYPEREASPVRPALAPHAAADLDQAELFLLSLDTELLTASPARVAYLLGAAEGHIANLVELVRGISDA